MEVLLLLVMGAMNVLCFVVGAKVGQTASKGEIIQMPAVNHLEAYRAKEERRVAKAEQDKYDTILQNVEAYDGTSNGQKDVPR